MFETTNQIEITHMNQPYDVGQTWCISPNRNLHREYRKKIDISPLWPIGSMYAIYDNIYHQYTPNVSIYTSTMDPMGDESYRWLRSYMGALATYNQLKKLPR